MSKWMDVLDRFDKAVEAVENLHKAVTAITMIGFYDDELREFIYTQMAVEADYITEQLELLREYGNAKNRGKSCEGHSVGKHQSDADPEETETEKKG